MTKISVHWYIMAIMLLSEYGPFCQTQMPYVTEISIQWYIMPITLLSGYDRLFCHTQIPYVTEINMQYYSILLLDCDRLSDISRGNK